MPEFLFPGIQTEYYAAPNVIFALWLMPFIFTFILDFGNSKFVGIKDEIK